MSIASLRPIGRRATALSALQFGVIKQTLCGAMTLAAVMATTLATPAAAEAAVAPAHALMGPGNLVVTGFSGTRLADKVVDAAKADADGVTIETNGASLRILDVSAISGPDADPATDASEIATFNARAIGQVFGVALDDALDPTTKSPAPNIYAAATSAYGLNIVLPPLSETGWPRRTLAGDPVARWMEGQWGEGQAADGAAAPGGPGSIWRIDGVSGQATLFATIGTNGRPTGAPSLGNIAYDATSHQFFVSDLESGLIHRLSLTGQDLGSFDHGASARAVMGLPPVPDDPSVRADIKSAHFRTDDPNSWGYAAPSRRVWGLNVSAGRLYYAVADGPEIWSVAIKSDGGFGDARREIIVPVDQGPFEITDIAFDSKGWIYLAQRPPVTGTQDYLLLAAQAPAKLLRYRPDPATNSWTEVPDEFHVGLTGEKRQSDGGVALGYGYTGDGKIDYGTCDGTLWATGDDLDRSPQRTAALGKSDAPDGSAGLNISGLQGSPTDPAAIQAKSLRFADYDGILPRASTRGQIGDVRVFKACGSPAAAATATAVEPAPTPTDLEVTKIARGACQLGGVCHIEVKIWNRGIRRYFGPLTIADTLDKAGARLVSTGPSRWDCGQGGADVSCHHPALDIGPGLSTSLFLDYRLPRGWSYPSFADCADIAWLGDLAAPDTIVAVEIALARRGLYAGAADRIAGPRLADAIAAYGAARGLGGIRSITPALIESLFGPGSAIGPDAAHHHDRACAQFRIDLPQAVEAYTPPPPIIDYIVPPIMTTTIIETACPLGYWSRYGECVRSCPWGYHAYGDRCFPDGGAICSGGWLSGGQCACPGGSVALREPNGHVACRPGPGGGPQRCLGGFFSGNRCLCPAGTEVVTNPNGSISCGRVQLRCEGGSVFNGQCRCPGGAAMIGGRCVTSGPGHANPVICPVGEAPRDGRCVPTGPVVHPPVACPVNDVLINGVCRPRTVGERPHQVTAPSPICPPGSIRRGAGCEPIRRGDVRPSPQVPIHTQVHTPTHIQPTVVRPVHTPPHPVQQQVRPVRPVQQVRPPVVQRRVQQPACKIVNGKCAR